MGARTAGSGIGSRCGGGVWCDALELVRVDGQVGHIVHHLAGAFLAGGVVDAATVDADGPGPRLHPAQHLGRLVADDEWCLVRAVVSCVLGWGLPRDHVIRSPAPVASPTAERAPNERGHHRLTGGSVASLVSARQGLITKFSEASQISEILTFSPLRDSFDCRTASEIPALRR